MLLYLLTTGHYAFEASGFRAARLLAVGGMGVGRVQTAAGGQQHSSPYSLTQHSTAHSAALLLQDAVAPQNVLLTLRNVAAGAYKPLPSHLSPALQHLIGSMLVVRADQRLSLPQVLAHSWLAAFVPAPAASTAAPATSSSASAEQQPMAVEAAAEVEAAEATAAADAGAAQHHQPAAFVTASDEAECGPVEAMEVEEAFTFVPPPLHQQKPTPATPRVISLTATTAPTVPRMYPTGSPVVEAAVAAAASTAAAAAAVAPEPKPRSPRASLFCALFRLGGSGRCSSSSE